MKKTAYRLGIDIGGTKVKIGILDKNKSMISTTSFQITLKDSKSILDQIHKSLLQLLNQEGIAIEQIASCGIGVPGTVSPEGQLALFLPNLNWVDVPFAEMFYDATGIPARLVQDSRAAALGESLAGEGQGKNVVMCVTLGTGIGTGIVMDGKIYDGALGGAGELGHVPVVRNGRLCACGKTGCLETYVAGKGLALSINQRKNTTDLTAEDLFQLAQKGDKDAREILDEAISLLGNTLTAAINLLSPDALLFSGGMSEQKELFVKPLIKYVYQHSYSLSVGNRFHVGYAALGTDAPMIGAALLPKLSKAFPRRRTIKLSASIMCADVLNLGRDLTKLEEASIDYIHFDIMDGHFVPNLMLPLDIISQIRKATHIPFDIHLMTQEPERYIPLLDLRKGDLVSVHWESTPHLQRAMGMIKEKGGGAILALNPSTPIECCRDLLEDAEAILLMTVNPGFAGQRVIPQSFDKIQRLRRLLDQLGYASLPIEVDGNCSYDNIPKMHLAGADMFVVGSSSIFDPALGIVGGTTKLRKSLEDR